MAKESIQDFFGHILQRDTSLSFSRIHQEDRHGESCFVVLDNRLCVVVSMIDMVNITKVRLGLAICLSDDINACDAGKLLSVCIKKFVARFRLRRLASGMHYSSIKNSSFTNMLSPSQIVWRR